MTRSKRPYLLDVRIDGLRSHLRLNRPHQSELAYATGDALMEALEACSWIPKGDRKTFAVAVCLYKLALFQLNRTDLQQRPNPPPTGLELVLVPSNPHQTDLQLPPNPRPTGFELVSTKTGQVISEDVAGAGLPELVLFPKGQWIRALHIATVVRLHRVGFTDVEIARLLPNSQQQTPTDINRDAKAIGAVVRKYRAQPAQPLRDFAYTPASWSVRMPP